MSIFDKIRGWLGVAAANPGEPSVETSPQVAVPAPATEAPPVAPRAAVTGSSRQPPPDAGKTKKTKKRRTTRQDDERIERAARLLVDAGRAADAISLLTDSVTLLCKHEPTSLPCLCALCLRPELDRASSQGIAFRRDFVVARQRVLFYWAPAELWCDATQVRASVRAELRARLATAPRSAPIARTNPFTGDLMPPAAQRAMINPFTGEPTR